MLFLSLCGEFLNMNLQSAYAGLPIITDVLTIKYRCRLLHSVDHQRVP